MSSSKTPRSSTRDEEEREAPPAYGGIEGVVRNDTADLGTQASLSDDGRVNVRISQKSKGLSDLLIPALRSQLDLLNQQVPVASRPQPSKTSSSQQPPISDRLRDAPLPLNVVIHVVGSRGDVQPFVALGKVLKAEYGHRVRLATHPVFKSFVEEHDLEFFTIGGDPSELMSFMVKNPGLMPGFDTMRSGDIGKRRKNIGEMIRGCWRSCIETGDGSGPSAVERTLTEEQVSADPKAKPFIADVIIANPPSFAHIHCAEKLGIPLHLMFTMPWSPTQMFPHPLANIQATNADASMTNYISYSLVDMLTWQGLGDVINRFRQKSLGLEPLSLQWAPGLLTRLKIPWTYCWSPTLIPKPQDWSNFIDISGFFFLSLADNYTPDPDLKAFLEAGPPPVYIGFGSIVVDDPNAMTSLIFEAVKKTGQRVLVSKGWGGLGAEDLGVPEGVFMLGNVPHDWLFKHVSAVVHHGGAGTCAAGIAAGKPTLVVPFFGDQPFWGAMVYRAGAGPMPIPHKELTSEKLAEAIQQCLSPEMQGKAKEMAAKIAHEDGTHQGAKSFHNMLDVETLRCTLAPKRAAVWRIRRTQVRLSAFAATVLMEEGLLTSDEIKLYRAQEHEVEEQPWDPMTGGASAIIGTFGTVAMSVADLPVQTLKALKIHPDSARSRPKTPSGEDATTDAVTPSPPLSTALTPTESQTTLDQDNGHLSPSTSKQTSQDPTGSHRYDVLGALGNEPEHSPSRSPGHSRSSSPDKPRSKSIAKDVVANNFDLEAITDTGKGMWRMIGGISKSPMDFTMNVARGFHNAPKIYGDEVRQTERITDLNSGLRAAGKEFMYGFGDGLAGLIKHPVEGARKEGAAGFIKGFGKGIGGIVLKPGAAIWGIPGYTSKGIYMELQKRFGPSVDNYIIASRTAQGLEEAGLASPTERAAIIRHYKELKPYIKRKKNIGEEQLNALRAKREDLRSRRKSGSKGLSSDSESSGNIPRVVVSHEANQGVKRSNTYDSDLLSPSSSHDVDTNPLDHFDNSTAPHPSVHNDIQMHDQEDISHPDPEFEAAIRDSLVDSSRGDPEEDAMLERAIRASVAELEAAHRQRRTGKDEKAHFDEEEYQAAIKASIAEAQRGRQQHWENVEGMGEQESGIIERGKEAAQADGEDGDELEAALKQSMSTYVQEGRAREEAERRDEESVVRYMMQQSLAEEEARKGGGGGGGGR